MSGREAEGREPLPTAIVVDSQSVNTTEAGGPRGFDAAKKIKGSKRQIAIDTLGLPIECKSRSTMFRIATPWLRSYVTLIAKVRS